MKQTVAFSSSIDIDIKDALKAAKISLPEINFDSVKTNIDLESLLNSAGETLFVRVDNNEQNITALKAELELQIQTREAVENMQCELPPPTFDETDINPQTDVCALFENPPEFPEPVKFPEEADLAQLEKEIADITAQSDADQKEALQCVSDMTKIAGDMKVLTDKEGLVRETIINLEELYYNYGIMSSYFDKRLETLDQILNTFDPLLTKKKAYEDEIDVVSPQESAARTNLNNATQAYLLQQQGSDTPGFPIFTQTDINNLVAIFNPLNEKLNTLKSSLQSVKDTIDFKKSGITPFLNNSITEGSDTTRRAALQTSLKTLLTGGGGVFSNVSGFSTRTKLKSSGGDSQSFDMTIQHTLKDEAGILAGKPLTFMKSDSTKIEPYDGSTPHGILYDRLYNIWADPDLFFSREERGLSANKSMADASLKGTGAETFKSSFIQDQTKFQEFYSNFESHHTAKVELVKSTIVQPALDSLAGGLNSYAVKEVQYLLAFGKAFEKLPADSTMLTDQITAIRQSSASHSSKYAELKNTLEFAKTQHKAIVDGIESKKQEFLNVKCAKKAATPPSSFQPPPPGSDPLGATTMQQIHPEDPNVTKFCYWMQFAKYATAVNILPIPGAGGFRYWPIGMKVPTPTGIINIPLPIIWIPIAQIVLTAGMFVIFIGQCGICPSPFVFFVGANGEKKFLVSLRPTQEFGANENALQLFGDTVIKTIDKGGIAIKKSMNSMVNKINVPGFNPITPDAKSTIVDDLKDKILKKVNKLGTPDITPITSKLSTHSTIEDKRNMLKEVASKHLDKISLPTIKIPKNGGNVNPKPPPVREVIDQMKKLFKMDLPTIAIPPGASINLKSKLTDQIRKIKVTELNFSDIPALNSNPTDSEKNSYMDKVRKALKDGISVGHAKITPKLLGVASTVAAGGVIFVAPYKCKPGATGLEIPPVPPAVLAGLAAMKIASDLIIDGTSLSQILKVTVNSGGALTKDFLPIMLAGILASLPDFNVPDPSKISIKDMLTDSAKKIVKMQKPSFPDPTKPPQLQIPLPGEALKTVLKTAVSTTLNSIPINDINFDTLSGIDMKQILIGIIEISFKPVETFVDPFLQITSLYKASKDKTLSEILGLKKLNRDDNAVATVTKEAMEAAIIALKGLALVPYPAVAFLPTTFMPLHPILAFDDLPPWNRLTLQNFLFVVFLDQFCHQGKVGSGLQENP